VDRILTIPNAISAARLAGVPVFLWLVLGPQTATADYWAVALLIVAGLSDWLDGKIARALNQTSRLGQVLDPAADRLYIAATIVALGVRAIIPWWLVAVLALRELTVGVALAVLRRRAGFGTLQVSFVGKAATLCLLYAFPLLFPWRSPRLGRDARPGTRLGFRGLGNRPVLVGRDAVPGSGQEPGQRHREFVK
jgi:Phosphatidylglycerophosphate synthase